MEQKIISKSYTALPEKPVIDKVSAALLLRGITTYYAESKYEALRLLKELIPPGAEVFTGSSTTLNQIGFTNFLKSGEHLWRNLKAEIKREKDKVMQNDLRKRSVLSEYFIDSAQAVTENGQILNASASGSQVPSISFTSSNMIFVVSTNKIVITLEEGIKRIYEHAFPLEDERMKKLGFPGSSVSRIHIFEREIIPERKISLIFVNEVLGF